jgi:hypothetical protein
MPNRKNNSHDNDSKGSMGELFTGFRRRLSSLISEPISSPVKEREFSKSYIEKASEIDGVKTSTDAMKACGMQPELASHLALQNKSLGISIILRAGSPPVYNQKRGPKTGINKSKTSTQGLFKGSLAVDLQFTRLNHERKGSGHDAHDEEHLNLTIKEPNYQHTVALPVTMQDILREVSENGDLEVLGYEDGKLRLGYREGKGDKDFNGQMVIDLTHGERVSSFYSRPWDRPDHDSDWDPNLKVIKKPAALSAVPDEVYQKVFNDIYTVAYTDTKGILTEESELKEARVFANTPRTSMELLVAIRKSEVMSVNCCKFQMAH